jgi:CHAT domain-containing protein/Tfp pilus assembly protein PilF
MRHYPCFQRISRIAFTLLFLIFPALVSSPVQAARSLQVNDPVKQCAQGWDLYRAGQYQEAFPLLEAGYANKDKVTFANPEDLGRCAMALGIIYQTFSQPNKALGAEMVALEIFETNEIPRGKATTLGEMGRAYYDLGQYDNALDHYQRSIETWQETGDEQNQGRILQAMSQVHRSLGEYAQALDLLQAALVIAREVGDRPAEGTTLGDIGVIYNSQGQHLEALKYFEQALKIQKEIDYKSRVGIILANMGVAYEGLERDAEALDHYQQALSMLRPLNDRQNEAILLSNIGNVYNKQGDYAKVLEYFQQALTIQREIGDRAGEATTLNNIGSVYHPLGQYDEALDYYQQALKLVKEIGFREGEAKTLTNIGMLYQSRDMIPEAIAELEKAMGVFETLRAGAGNQTARASYIAQFSNPYDVAISMYLQSGQKEKAFFTTERARARAFLDSLAQGPMSLINEANSGLSAVLDVTQTQSLLDKKTTMLSFWTMDDSVLVFILTRTAFETVIVPVAPSELYEKIETFRNFASTADPHPESARELYHALIDPIKDHIKNSHLIIIPQDQLHYFPFNALTDGQRYLTDDYIIADLPSASTLPFIQKNAQETDGQALILGNSMNLPNPLGPLPFAEEEAKDTASQLGVSVYVREAATESLVKQQASQTKILHLAAHGRFNRETPLSSFIALTPDQDNDGLLTVEEVYGLDLQNTELVVLSACETQIGQLTEGDEFVGLTRAFLFAGAPTVIASLWKVDDESTSLLMRQFYAHYLGGMSKGEALRQAQIDIRKDYPHPYYWAGFVLSGDPGTSNVLVPPTTVTTSPPTEPNTFPCSSAVLVLAFVLLFKPKRNQADL